jgi:DNA mismatch endonuclease (patch repair protein)
MSGIKGNKTKPEVTLRRVLYAFGFPFRLNSEDVYGRPDIVLPKHRAVVFVHGGFWHYHEGFRFGTSPSRHAEFWAAMFDAKIARDRSVCRKLLDEGWRVAIVWECTLTKPDQVVATAELVSAWLHSNEPWLELGK